MSRALYNKYSAKRSNKVGLIFLSGFKSDMTGTKSQAIAAYAKENDHDLIRFDYFGHGQSSGKFTDGTIGLWLENTLAVIDSLADDKPQILIGSSMGGWIMLLAAIARPKIIAGLIGLAAAPDFIEELIWDYMSGEQKQKLQKDGIIDFSNEFCEDAYPISLKLVEEARSHLLLNKKIPINVPVRLIHGMDDKDVPYHTSIRIAEKIETNDVHIELLKNAGHRLSNPEELEVIYRTISETIVNF